MNEADFEHFKDTTEFIIKTFLEDKNYLPKENELIRSRINGMSTEEGLKAYIKEFLTEEAEKGELKGIDVNICFKELWVNITNLDNKRKIEGKYKTTITTVTTVTTVTKIKSWGHIDLTEEILIEQIEEDIYLCNYKGYKGLNRVFFGNPEGDRRLENDIAILKAKGLKQKDFDKEVTKITKKIEKEYPPFYYLSIEGNLFRFKEKPEKALYPKPSIKECNEFLKGNIEIRSFKELYGEIKRGLQVLYDFKFKYDTTLTALAIASSWVLPLLKAIFFLGIDATKGGGKTTLLEILKCLIRHGFMAGDVSYSAIPRLKDEFDMNILVDEIDQLNENQKTDIEGLMRKGQRRGNPYTRLNKNTLKAEVFESFGFYSYTFRQDVEDAFKSRSILVHSAVSGDNKLPIINYMKEELLSSLSNDLFFWYFENILKVGNLVTVVTKLPQLRGLDTDKKNIEDFRIEVYESILSNFSKEEKEVFEGLVGRNIEIGYIILTICKLLGLDLQKEIKEVLDLKQRNEDIPDQYYIEKLKDFLNSKLIDNSDKGIWYLSKGIFEGCYYYPKHDLYSEYLGVLKDKNVSTIGTSKFNGFLRDIGFILDDNVINQKHFTKGNTLKCCIFDKKICKAIGIAFKPKQIAKEENVDLVPKKSFTELDKDYSGRCSYCGLDNKWIKFKDQGGSHLCNDCYKVEVKIQ